MGIQGKSLLAVLALVACFLHGAVGRELTQAGGQATNITAKAKPGSRPNMQDKGLIDILQGVYQSTTGCVRDSATGRQRNWCGQKCGLHFTTNDLNGWTLDDTDRCCRQHDIDLEPDISATSAQACPAHKRIVSCLRGLPQYWAKPIMECYRTNRLAFWCSSSTCWSGCAWRFTGRYEAKESDAKNMADGFNFLRGALGCKN